MSNASEGAAERITASVVQAQSVVQARVEWTIASDIREIEPLVAKVTSLCRAAGISARACRFNVPVALTEALSNAIIRGNADVASRRVYISAEVNSTSLVIEVTDEGQGFDPSNVTFSPLDPDWLEREDGRGLFLMRSLMDRVELERAVARDAGQTVRMVLHRT